MLPTWIATFAIGVKDRLDPDKTKKEITQSATAIEKDSSSHINLISPPLRRTFP